MKHYNIVAACLIVAMAACGSGIDPFEGDGWGDDGPQQDLADSESGVDEDALDAADSVADDTTPEGPAEVPDDGAADDAAEVIPDVPVDTPEETDGVSPCIPISDLGCGEEEVCDDGLDNNCDGHVDEGCYCSPGETGPCFRGYPAHRGVGGCVDGTHVCPSVGEFPQWGECEGGIIEGEEICDGKDNDCNGCTDEIPDCYPDVLCPSDDYSAPLHWYELNGDAIYPGTPLAWYWSVTAPAGSTVTAPECPTCKNTQLWIDVSGDWLVHVEFIDELGRDYVCEFVIHVRGPGIRVEMWWNEGVGGDMTDVDLHFHRNPPTNAYFNLDDCYYSNCDNYVWGYRIAWSYAVTPSVDCPTPAPSGSDYSTGCPNPRLDLDDVEGNGPENINLDNPNDEDSFRVVVHYYDDEGRVGLAAPTYIRVYCGGVMKSLFGPADIYSQSWGTGDIWRVCDIEWDADLSDCVVTPLGEGGSFDIRPDSSRSTF